MNTESLKKYAGSISKQNLIYAIGSLVLLLAVFKLGELVGYHKATFAFRGGDNYYRAFENKKGVLPPQFPDAHGAAGKVVSVGEGSIVVADRDGTEKTVVFTQESSFRRGRSTADVSSIPVGDMVVVIGSPDTEGRIIAKLIRSMPPAPLPASEITQ